MSLSSNIERIERMHRMIAHKRTGCPKEFARKMGVSRSMIYQLIRELKALGAPISYCKYYRSYKYIYPVDFKIGFDRSSVSTAELRQVDGGSFRTTTKLLTSIQGFGLLRALDSSR